MPRFARSLLRHAALTLRLNIRSKRAIAYGYAMPLFFVVAFASVFRGEDPPLAHQMGQLLTLSILGSAALGLPTALVAERARGVWRLYRLAPVPASALLAGTALARLTIVVSAAALQVLAARAVYGTPFPPQPAFALGAVLLVSLAFLGLGAVIAVLADDVPAVQALGQGLFLPMVLLGGVGVPVTALPAWAQGISGFMPGRYAVELIQAGFTGAPVPSAIGFDAVALALMGAAAAWIGLTLFRWDRERVAHRGPALLIPLLTWTVVGVAAATTGRLAPMTSSASAYRAISDADVAQIRFDDLPGDNELVTRLAPPFRTAAEAERMRGFVRQLSAWPLSQDPDPLQELRNLLSAAALADITAAPQEAEIARAVFVEIEARHPRRELRQMLAWLVLHPKEGTVATSAPELGFRRPLADEFVRQRVILYAKKLLGRVTGAIPDEPLPAPR